MKTPIDNSTEAGNLKALMSAFTSASLIDVLRSPGHHIVCAPTHAAFKRLPAGSLDALFKGARTLTPFLSHEAMPGLIAANDSGRPN